MESEPPPTDLPAPAPEPDRIRRRIGEKKFVDAVVVRTEDGARYRVPRTAEAAQATKQLMAARVVDLFTKAAKKWENAKLTPKEMRDIMEATKAAGELMDSAYGATGEGEIGKLNSQTAIGNLLGNMVRVGAEVAGSNAIEEMRKLNDLGKKANAAVKKAEPVIDVEPGP